MSPSAPAETPRWVLELDGSSLTIEDVARVARDPSAEVRFSAESVERIVRCRRRIEEIATTYADDFHRYRAGETEAPPVQDYGVTTGFGEFKDIPVPPEDLEALQRNILLSHSVGTGVDSDADNPAGYYAPDVIRATLLLRLNTFAKGHSGLRLEVAEAVRRMLNRGICPRVPLHGSVGSSGDLCPLAHLFVVFLGEGSYLRVTEGDDLRRPGRLEPRAAGDHLVEDLGLEPPAPSYKEGLALVNGATFSAAVLALAVADAENLVRAADIAAGLSAEAFCGCARAFDAKVHAARGQLGQIASAANLRTVTTGSQLLDSAAAVQDPYSIRCAPAVHGASRDAVAHARQVAEREINAATDNPLFFPGPDGEAHSEDPFDFDFRGNWPQGYRGDLRASYSAGNFHGQPIGLVADFLGLAVAEIGSISERRGQLLLDGMHNRGLPSNLISRGGVNSGLMITQYCAAGLVSENKVLAHPASADSIPTSANSEDHNAMATIAARKLRTMIQNVQAVLAIELLVSAQAVEWRLAMGRRPEPPRFRPPKPGESVSLERARGAWRKEEQVAHDLEDHTRSAERPAIAAGLGRGSRHAYRAVRAVAEPMLEDRTLDGDIRAVRALLEDGDLVKEVEEGLGEPLLGSV